MMTPEVATIWVGKMNLRNLHEVACEFAEEEFRRNGCCPPFFLLAHKDEGYRRIVCKWSDDREQMAARNMIRMLLFLSDAPFYSWGSEAWTTYQVVGEPEKERPGGRIENMPEEDREEIMMIYSHSRGDEMTDSRWLINSKTGKPFLGVRVDDFLAGGKAAGRMMNLFNQPPDARMMKVAQEVYQDIVKRGEKTG